MCAANALMKHRLKVVSNRKKAKGQKKGKAKYNEETFEVKDKLQMK